MENVVGVVAVDVSGDGVADDGYDSVVNDSVGRVKKVGSSLDVAKSDVV